MIGYDALKELVGAKNVPDFADKLRQHGIKYYDEQTYRMAQICHEDPQKIQSYGREFVVIIPQTIKTILAWEESIIDTFKSSQEPQRSSVSNINTIEEAAYNYLYDQLLEIARGIPFKADNPLLCIGACKVLDLDPDNLSLGDILEKLFND